MILKTRFAKILQNREIFLKSVKKTRSDNKTLFVIPMPQFKRKIKNNIIKDTKRKFVAKFSTSKDCSCTPLHPVDSLTEIGPNTYTIIIDV